MLIHGTFSPTVSIIRQYSNILYHSNFGLNRSRSVDLGHLVSFLFVLTRETKPIPTETPPLNDIDTWYFYNTRPLWSFRLCLSPTNGMRDITHLGGSIYCRQPQRLPHKTGCPKVFLKAPETCKAANLNALFAGPATSLPHCPFWCRHIQYSLAISTHSASIPNPRSSSI